MRERGSTSRGVRLHRWLLVASASALAFCTVILGLGAWLANRQLTVTVTNADSQRLNSVVVHVTGRSYPIGNVAPQESVTVPVEPTSESHVEVEFVDTHGDGKRLMAGCYIEPGYKGNVSIELNENKVVAVRERINIF